MRSQEHKVSNYANNNATISHKGSPHYHRATTLRQNEHAQEWMDQVQSGELLGQDIMSRAKLGSAMPHPEDGVNHMGESSVQPREVKSQSQEGPWMETIIARKGKAEKESAQGKIGSNARKKHAHSPGYLNLQSGLGTQFSDQVQPRKYV